METIDLNSFKASGGESEPSFCISAFFEFHFSILKDTVFLLVPQLVLMPHHKKEPIVMYNKNADDLEKTFNTMLEELFFYRQ